MKAGPAVYWLGVADEVKEESMAELKPCPFCGKAPVIMKTRDGKFYVRCDNLACGVFPATMEWPIITDVIKAWNRREGDG